MFLCATSTGAIPAKSLLAARAACPARLPPASIVHSIYSRASHNAFVPANNACRCFSLTLAYKQILGTASKGTRSPASHQNTASDSIGSLSQTRSGSLCTGTQSVSTIFLVAQEMYSFLVSYRTFPSWWLSSDLATADCPEGSTLVRSPVIRCRRGDSA